MINTAYLLDDNAMKRFIMNGYVTVELDFPMSFHDTVYRKTEEILEKGGNPRNNLLPRIPELQQVFDHPSVRGVLASILGSDYYLHPHRHCHDNRPGSKGQNMHKDSLHNSRFAVDGNRRHHHTRWAMAFYYPQDTSVEMGPTAVLPRSQYLNEKPSDDDELALWGKAGTVTIVHYDVFHRGMPNNTDKTRYMIKFLFTRMSEPQSPSWMQRNKAWTSIEDGQEEIWGHLWDWHCGESNSQPAGNGKSVSALSDQLRDESELTALRAAYQLGQIGSEAIPALIDALSDESESVRRNAAYGFSPLGEVAVPTLVEAAQSSDEGVRARAVDILGDIGLPAQETIPALFETLKDESATVRSHTAEALGTIAQSSNAAVAPLTERLKDDEDLVRRNAALSLARIGPHATEAIPALSDALHDENHFVRAFSLQALRRVATAEATEAMVGYLQTVRWCPSH